MIKCASCGEKIEKVELDEDVFEAFQCDKCGNYYHFDCEYTGKCKKCDRIICSNCDTVHLCEECDEWYCSQCETVDTCCDCGESYCNACKENYWHRTENYELYCPECYEKVEGKLYEEFRMYKGIKGLVEFLWNHRQPGVWYNTIGSSAAYCEECNIPWIVSKDPWLDESWYHSKCNKWSGQLLLKFHPYYHQINLDEFSRSLAEIFEDEKYVKDLLNSIYDTGHIKEDEKYKQYVWNCYRKTLQP